MAARKRDVRLDAIHAELKDLLRHIDDLGYLDDSPLREWLPAVKDLAPRLNGWGHWQEAKALQLLVLRRGKELIAWLNLQGGPGLNQEAQVLAYWLKPGSDGISERLTFVALAQSLNVHRTKTYRIEDKAVLRLARMLRAKGTTRSDVEQEVTTADNSAVPVP